MDLLKELPRLMPLACKWAESEASRILATGVTLDPVGLRLASCVGVRAPEQVRVLFVPTIPRPAEPALAQACDATGIIGPETRGLTLGHGVFIRERDEANPWLLAHELRHVSQYEGFGSIAAFLGKYLPELVQFGPTNSPLELDASEAADGCA
jgi:hypothetical protein